MNQDEFKTDVRSCFSKNQYTVDGKSVEGAAVSDLLNCLRSRTRGSAHVDRRWSNLGNLSNFERVLNEEGFEVAPGRNRRNQRVRIVFELPDYAAAARELIALRKGLETTDWELPAQEFAAASGLDAEYLYDAVLKQL